jgi:hypothetical protein
MAFFKKSFFATFSITVLWVGTALAVVSTFYFGGIGNPRSANASNEPNLAVEMSRVFPSRDSSVKEGDLLSISTTLSNIGKFAANGTVLYYSVPKDYVCFTEVGASSVAFTSVEYSNDDGITYFPVLEDCSKLTKIRISVEDQILAGTQATITFRQKVLAKLDEGSIAIMSSYAEVNGGDEDASNNLSEISIPINK